MVTLVLMVSIGITEVQHYDDAVKQPHPGINAAEASARFT